jgi:hypothetical protein
MTARTTVHLPFNTSNLAARLALAILFLVSACTTGNAPGEQPSVGAIRGRVLDVETGEPLADAHVIARYIGTNAMWAHSEDVCRRIEYAKTGSDGVFQFPSGETRDSRITAFKAGFQREPRPFFLDERLDIVDGKEQRRFHVYPRDPVARAATPERIFLDRDAASTAAGAENEYLKRFIGTRAEQFNRLWSYVSGTNCLNAGERRKNIVPFLTAVYAEMSTLAVTPTEKDRLQLLAKIIESEKTAR